MTAHARAAARGAHGTHRNAARDGCTGLAAGGRASTTTMRAARARPSRTRSKHRLVLRRPRGCRNLTSTHTHSTMTAGSTDHAAGGGLRSPRVSPSQTHVQIAAPPRRSSQSRLRQGALYETRIQQQPQPPPQQQQQPVAASSQLRNRLPRAPTAWRRDATVSKDPGPGVSARRTHR
jgi:hypothetical protein